MESFKPAYFLVELTEQRNGSLGSGLFTKYKDISEK